MSAHEHHGREASDRRALNFAIEQGNLEVQKPLKDLQYEAEAAMGSRIVSDPTAHVCFTTYAIRRKQ